MELFYEIVLLSCSMELFYGVVLWSCSMELFYGVVLWSCSFGVVPWSRSIVPYFPLFYQECWPMQSTCKLIDLYITGTFQI